MIQTNYSTLNSHRLISSQGGMNSNQIVSNLLVDGTSHVKNQVLLNPGYNPYQNLIGETQVKADASWMPHLQFVNPDFNNELKKISYFELFQELPQITQLFNTEYIDLVKNLVTLQDQNLQTDSQIFQTSLVNPSVDIGQITDRVISKHTSEAGLELSTEPLIIGQGSNTLETSQKTTEAESSIIYNHSHAQLENKTKPKTINKQHLRQKDLWKDPEQEMREYRDNKKDNQDNNLTKNLVKYTIKTLNKAALKLSKFV